MVEIGELAETLLLVIGVVMVIDIASSVREIIKVLK